MATLVLKQPVLGPEPGLTLPALKRLGPGVCLLVPVEVAHAAELGWALVACEGPLPEVSVAVHGEVPAAGEALGADVAHKRLELLLLGHRHHLLCRLPCVALVIEEAVGILGDEGDGVWLWKCLAIHEKLAAVAG